MSEDRLPTMQEMLAAVIIADQAHAEFCDAIAMLLEGGNATPDVQREIAKIARRTAAVVRRSIARNQEWKNA